MNTPPVDNAPFYGWWKWSEKDNYRWDQQKVMMISGAFLSLVSNVILTRQFENIGIPPPSLNLGLI